MRFLADEMVFRLARLLRAAGYDTYLAAGGQGDSELLEIARAENRILLTRDKALAARAHPRAVLIGGRGVEAEAQALSAMLPIDWKLAPFSRCVVDNAPLRDATAEEQARMPPEAVEMGGPFRACPACGRAYWPGSHVRRMTERLAVLAQMPPQALL
jgi:uncharacterized protein with PIN domain